MSKLHVKLLWLVVLPSVENHRDCTCWDFGLYFSWMKWFKNIVRSKHEFELPKTASLKKSVLPTKSLYYLHSRRTNLHCQEIPPLSPCPCPELRGLRDHSPNRSLYRGETGDFPKVQWLEPLVKWCFHSHAVSIFIVFLIKAVYPNSSNKHSIQENKIKKQKTQEKPSIGNVGVFFLFP